MFVWGIEKRLRGKLMDKKQIWAMDTEDDSKGNVQLINFYDGHSHFTFTSTTDALNWLTQTKGYIEIWCVNLQYDLINLFREKLSCLEINFVGSRVISATLKNHSLQFRDTLNHWKMSVENMGKRIGLPKLKVKNGNFNDIKYCRRDTEITYKFVMKMKEYYESFGCELKKTIGSTALTYYYKEFGTRPKKPMPENQLEFCLSGYYGGRTEIFFNKPITGNIWYFDINSLYPYSMLNKFPLIESSYWTKKPNFNREGMSEVTIVAPKIQIPYLPYRDVESGRLLFPCGTFRGVYTHFEIRESLHLGYRVSKVHKTLEFRGTCNPFKEFIESLYAKRMQAQSSGDELLSDSFKLIMNNLYGKFGQGRDYQKLIPYNKKTIKNGDTVYGNMVLRTEIGEYPKHTNGIWSAYTTAYGRHNLYRKFIEVERSGGLLIYGDTDSIIFEAERKIFAESKALGGLKSEGEFDYAHFKLPKVYVLRAKKQSQKIYKAKGVPKDKACDFFETGRATYRRPYKIKETLRRNISPKRKIPLIMNYWELTSKDLNQKYDKRKVLASGHTKPLVIGVTQ